MDETPFALGLIGYPLGHSLSPQLHNAALKAMGIQGEYHLHPISPLPEGRAALDALLDQVLSGEIHGLNVTIPHKQNVLNRLGHASAAVRSVGAANTLFLCGKDLWGDNTDIPGFLCDLADLGPFHGTGALVLGAGGAARAAVYALACDGWGVTVAARRLEQAQELAESLKTTSTLPEGTRIEAIQFEPGSLIHYFHACDAGLIVNTTPVGMHPHPDASPWLDGVPFPQQVAVYDMIYNPRETTLLRQARQNGLRAKNGLGMLVEQAALALEIWTGKRVPREAMWDAVLPPDHQEVNHAA